MALDNGALPDGLVDVPLPHIDDATVVVPPPGDGVGFWAGGPSAVSTGDGPDGAVYLAYRLRRPIGRGRGFANVVARSTDGITFETLITLSSDDFGAESLERPALVRLPDGRWRIYVSCATPGTKHWRVVMMEADAPSQFDPAKAGTVLPGDTSTAVKDPVIRLVDGRWLMWATLHPLESDDDADRMTTAHATSDDGVTWAWQGTALDGRRDGWDSRGVRMSCLLLDRERPVAYYDGRATAEENYEERTGLAVAVNGHGSFRRAGDDPVSFSPFGAGGLRYLDVLRERDGWRLYYEFTRPDGAHDLRTELLVDRSR
jgi:hypothetical protein